MNFNTIYFKGTGDYNNGIRHSNSFGTVTGFEGPVLFGQNGGALGSSIGNSNWNNSGTKVALSWNANQDVKIHKALVFPDGTVQTSAGQTVVYNTSTNYYTYQGNVNIPGTLKLGTNSLYLGGVSSGIPGSTNEIYTDGGALQIQSNSNSGFDQNTIINNGNTGKVGIGTATPDNQSKLHVVGNFLQDGKSMFKDKVGIGIADFSSYSTQHNYMLEVIGNARVNGRIDTKDICITPTAFCDYVFDKDYKLNSLPEVKKYIDKNKHLPYYPSEETVIKNGISVTDITLSHTRTIEEMMLYLIKQNEEIERLKAEIETIKSNR